MSKRAGEFAWFVGDQVAQALIGIPIDFRPGAWASSLAGHIGTAHAPGIPFNPLQIGRFQHQPDGSWKGANWDGQQWVPGSVVPDEETKKILDWTRNRLLDEDKQKRQDIEDAVNRSLPLSGDILKTPIDPDTNSRYRDARNWRYPVDPLMLDLDGDGLELTRASGQVLFDHDGDGIRTGTGWIGRDDGILVRDLNGDGLISTGLELFGDNTLKRNGQRAAHGFEVLADLDANADGQFTSADAAWAGVKVWRDLDQDGVSDAGELFGLDALGISRIGVVGSASNATGGTQAGTTVNGNAVEQSASFTQDGQEHTVGIVATDRTVGAIDVENNPFHREFTSPLPNNPMVAHLPDMQGSGRVRDLREAAGGCKGRLFS